MPTFADDGVVIRLWDFSETSQTASIFTREHGLIRGLAKGARRPHSKFSGGFDLLTRGQIVAIVKPGVELANIIEWDLQEVFWAARRDLRAHYAALYFVDLIAHAITDHDPHPTLFDALVVALRAVEDPDARALAALRFQWAALAETGYKPVLDRDAVSGEQLAPARAYGFSPNAGGVTTDPGRNSTGVWRVRPETIDALAAAADAAPSRNGDAPSPNALAGANRLLAQYFAVVLGRAPPTQAPFVERCLANR